MTDHPVRVVRGEDGQAQRFSRLYPCGEGAGVTPVALDGLRIVEAVAEER